jgi:hypothetical protein
MVDLVDCLLYPASFVASLLADHGYEAGGYAELDG